MVVKSRKSLQYNYVPGSHIRYLLLAMGLAFCLVILVVVAVASVIGLFAQ